MDMSMLYCFIGGALGALIKDIVKDGKIIMPKFKNGEFYLGFLSGVLIGGVVGWLANHNIVNAFTAGFMGSAVLPNLIAKNGQNIQVSEEKPEEIIRRVALEMGVDPELAVRVARCESNLDPKARNVNSPDSIDRGIFQINNKWHPEVSDEQADDVEFSARFFCQAVKDGHLNWWDCSKACWDK